jgi:F0F1-type ATP synthase epsilon subunit
MKLDIVGPLQRETFSIAWLEVNSPAGNFVIQPGHAPMIITLNPNQDITFCLTNGKIQTHFITSGILEVNRKIATIILAT